MEKAEENFMIENYPQAYNHLMHKMGLLKINLGEKVLYTAPGFACGHGGRAVYYYGPTNNGSHRFCNKKPIYVKPNPLCEELFDIELNKLERGYSIREEDMFKVMPFDSPQSKAFIKIQGASSYVDRYIDETEE